MKVIKCNFSGIYAQENFLDGTVLDFTSLGETECYCSSASAAVIRSALAPYGPGGIHWLDSGDYHYVSLFKQLTRTPVSFMPRSLASSKSCLEARIQVVISGNS